MPSRSKPAETTTPLLEWIAAGIGLVFLSALLIAIGHDAVTGASTQDPQIDVRVIRVHSAGKGYVVAFEVLNRSGGTAASVQIEGRLDAADATSQTSVATVDYVPGMGKSEGGLYFSSDPDAGKLIVRATGFQRP